ncbi:hypothetical protein TorRG33x02_293240, partial [Trema orientale]
LGLEGRIFFNPIKFSLAEVSLGLLTEYLILRGRNQEESHSPVPGHHRKRTVSILHITCKRKRHVDRDVRQRHVGGS